MVPCEVLLVRNTSTSTHGSSLVEVVVDSLARPAFADQLVWLVDSGDTQMMFLF